MVANITDRFVPPPEPFIAGRWRVPRLRHHEVQAMVRLGIIPEDASYEVLSGLIVLKDRAARNQDPSRVGPAHRKCVERLSALRSRIDSSERHVECQQPLICTDTHVPEPDFMILRGRLDDYSDLPTAADAYCVIEVADSSLERDTTEKLAGYARAGIPQYIVINLRDNTVEEYTNPLAAESRYAKATTHPVGQVFPLHLGQSQSLPVAVADLVR